MPNTKPNGPGRSLRVPTKRPSKPETDPLRLRTDTAHAHYKINVAQSQIRETSRIRTRRMEESRMRFAMRTWCGEEHGSKFTYGPNNGRSRTVT